MSVLTRFEPDDVVETIRNHRTGTVVATRADGWLIVRFENAAKLHMLRQTSVRIAAIEPKPPRSSGDARDFARALIEKQL